MSDKQEVTKLLENDIRIVEKLQEHINRFKVEEIEAIAYIDGYDRKFTVKKWLEEYNRYRWHVGGSSIERTVGDVLTAIRKEIESDFKIKVYDMLTKVNHTLMQASEVIEGYEVKLKIKNNEIAALTEALEEQQHKYIMTLSGSFMKVAEKATPAKPESNDQTTADAKKPTRKVGEDLKTT